MTFFKNMFLKI